MTYQLGYEENSNEGDNSGNSRDGYSEETVITGDNREFAIQVPRDREGIPTGVILSSSTNTPMKFGRPCIQPLRLSR